MHGNWGTVTDRLYYHDSTLLEFEARIVKTTKGENGWITILDRTAFYPTSGGQSHDTGFLSGKAVIDVTERSDGEILHITAESAGKEGDTVHGQVDAMRRLIHRQSHTAQHILSQAFMQTSKAKTVSVHLGDDYCSIELDCESLSNSQINESLLLANEIILTNLPVSILFVSAKEAAKLPLRKIPKREGIIRVIQIGDFDYSACGGTHSPFTAEVRLIHLLRTDKLRSHLVVSFLAGESALADFSRLTAVTHKMSTHLTCGIEEMSDRVEKLIVDLKESRSTIAQLQNELLPVRVTSLAGKAKQEKSLSFVSEQLSDSTVKTARTLALSLAEEINGLAILKVDENLILAVSENLSLNASVLVKEIATLNGLRGGGNEKLAQLGGVTPECFADLSSKLVTMAADEYSS